MSQQLAAAPAPRTNRVDPFGRIFATDARGDFMGNRGCLHNDLGQLQGRPWRHKAWIICGLQFRGRRQVIMAPGHYTQLFFLDEATALAAGHRPCAECRRDRYKAFQAALQSAEGATSALPAKGLDERLHAERLASEGRVRSKVSELPDGSMIAIEGEPRLIWGGRTLKWRPEGYVESAGQTPEVADVLTPPTAVAALRGGYVPTLHASAALLSGG